MDGWTDRMYGQDRWMGSWMDMAGWTGWVDRMMHG